MLFTSTVFLFLFLPLVLLLQYVLPIKLRNASLFLASVFFYAWGEVFYSGIILVSILGNFTMTRIMTSAPTGGRRRALLAVTVALNLALLGWFKYANFLVENLNGLLRLMEGPAIHLAPVHLPIGISFFTFQALSYVVDAYYGRVAVQKRIVDLGLYIALFPQLIAGPIVRYADIAAEIVLRRVNLSCFAYGVRRFIIGMGKKMILANPMGEVADKIFALSPGEWTTPLAWIGIACYTLQIYFDFSGYSDMAIGLGRILGFTFKENFQYPYAAPSIREFWRRWHISLSSWFRDYLYIPLGGSQASPLRTICNLWLVFLLCGLWLGMVPAGILSFGAVCTGAFCLERTRFDRLRGRLWRPLQHAYTLLVVMGAWVFFRIETLPEALDFIGVMAGTGAGQAPVHPTIDLLTLEHWLVFGAAILGCISWREVLERGADLWGRLASRFHQPSKIQFPVWLAAGGHMLNLVALMSILILSIMHIAVGTYNPFIYFRF